MKLTAIAATLLFTAAAHAATFTGSLEFVPDAKDEISVAGDNWLTKPVTMSWTVTNEDASPTGYAWHYSYEFTISAGKTDLSHIIIETSPSFTQNDITGVAGVTLNSLESQKVDSGNPGMPSDIYGLRFTPLSRTADAKFSFFSDRAPVWGDFYAKGGGGKNDPDMACNRGLSASDYDPTGAPDNDSIGNHILRPDTASHITSVPLPAASWAGMALGIVMATARYIRRRRAE